MRKIGYVLDLNVEVSFPQIKCDYVIASVSFWAVFLLFAE